MMINSPGVNEFIDLSDAPHSYTGQAAKVVKVNAGETAVEFGIGGGGGATAFTSLTDVPASYSDSNSRFVKVNATATGLEFVAGGGGGGTVNTIVPGANVLVDSTDPANPIVSAYFSNVEGGVASSTYLASQAINGGGA